MGVPATLVIRNATPDEVPALVAMINAAYRRSEGHVFPTTERIERTGALKRLDGIVVAEADGALAGSIHIELDERGGHFGMLATDVAMQRRGVASALIAHAEQVARDAGCLVMRIEVVREGGALPLYERLGYRIVRESPGQEWNNGQDWGAAIPWHMIELEKVL
jgi:GNAT superfamily N-acetyltransferase